jgi:hypothetical protein
LFSATIQKKNYRNRGKGSNAATTILSNCFVCLKPEPIFSPASVLVISLDFGRVVGVDYIVDH